MTTIYEFNNKLFEAQQDEEKAYNEYVKLSYEAQTLGLDHAATILRNISKDEAKHANELEVMRKLPVEPTTGERTWPEELAWREKSGFGELHRPFPETYGDWVSLAEDIKQKMPEESWYIVNELLQTISKEEGPVVDEAKRWLMNKAGELGIS